MILQTPIPYPVIIPMNSGPMSHQEVNFFIASYLLLYLIWAISLIALAISYHSEKKGRYDNYFDYLFYDRLDDSGLKTASFLYNWVMIIVSAVSIFIWAAIKLSKFL